MHSRVFNVGIGVHQAMKKARVMMHIIKSVDSSSEILMSAFAPVAICHFVGGLSSTCYPDSSDLLLAAVNNTRPLRYINTQRKNNRGGLSLRKF